MLVRTWVYGPILVAALAWGVSAGEVGFAGFCLLIPAGLLAWTVLEYLIHRFAFHGFAPHWQHHENPTDPAYILAPLWLSLSAAGALGVGFALALHSGARAALIVAGIVVGYLAYELVHLAIHSPRAGGRFLRTLRKRHYYHHFASDRVCYGVTSPLWDAVFRSLPQRGRETVYHERDGRSAYDSTHNV